VGVGRVGEGEEADRVGLLFVAIAKGTLVAEKFNQSLDLGFRTKF